MSIAHEKRIQALEAAIEALQREVFELKQQLAERTAAKEGRKRGQQEAL